MYPTTGYTPVIDRETIERNRREAKILIRENAERIAQDQIAYLLETGHSETAHALQSMLQHGQEMLDE